MATLNFHIQIPLQHNSNTLLYTALHTLLSCSEQLPYIQSAYITHQGYSEQLHFPALLPVHTAQLPSPHPSLLHILSDSIYLQYNRQHTHTHPHTHTAASLVTHSCTVKRCVEMWWRGEERRCSYNIYTAIKAITSHYKI